MKVVEFTFCRDAVRYDCPVGESIHSILPIEDEFIVDVGRCEDRTLELIQRWLRPAFYRAIVQRGFRG